MIDNTEINQKYRATELGALPVEWRIENLGDHLSTIRNGITKQQNKEGIGLPVTRIETIKDDRIDLNRVGYVNELSNEEIQKYRLICGDILFSHINSEPQIGRSVIYDNEPPLLLHGMNLLVMHTKNELNSYFLNFLFRFYRENGIFIEISSRSVNQNSINQGKIKSLKIPLPPLPEQHAIAITLRTVQEAKENTEAVIAATKALKAAMMKHLFTYGPVPPEEAERVALMETEIGQVPEEWEVRRIGDVSIFQPGYAFKSEDYVDSGTKLFKISNVSFGITNWKDVSYLPSSYLDEFKQYQLKMGDLVIAMTRPIVQGGIKISRISSNDCPCLLNQRVGRFIPKSTINLDFLYQSLFNNSFIDAIGDGAGGSQQPNISGKQIERILIPVPSIEIQKQIALILSSIDQKLAAEQSHKEALDTLFTSLLHDLMTAKIRVKNIA